MIYNRDFYNQPINQLNEQISIENQKLNEHYKRLIAEQKSIEQKIEECSKFEKQSQKIKQCVFESMRVLKLLEFVSDDKKSAENIQTKLQTLTLDSILEGNDTDTWIANHTDNVQNYTSENVKDNPYKEFLNLNIGDTFEFGIYKGKAVKWRILSKSNDNMFVISEKILCDKIFSENGSNNWGDSYLRKWLNNDFYNRVFNDEEQEYIENINGDMITLLTEKDADNLMDKKTRAIGSRWWLRSPYPIYSNHIWCVSDDGNFSSLYASTGYGVRPAFSFRLF